MDCTWENCELEAVHEATDRLAKSWAKLCNYHNIKLDEACSSGNVKAIAKAWIKAQGREKYGLDSNDTQND